MHPSILERWTTSLHSDFVVFKFSPHLTQQFPRQIIHTFSAGFVRLRGVAVDASGRTYGAGDLRDASTAFKLAGVVAQSGGYVQTFQAPGSFADSFLGLTVDGSGNAYVAAFSFLPSGDIYQVLKYDPTGTLLWNVSPFGGLSFGDVIKLDAQSNIYAVSSLGVAKYSQGVAPQLFLSTSTGDAQVGDVNKPLPVPLTVLVQDQNHVAQSNVAVNFAISIPTSPVGQALQSVDPQTGVDGKARATLTLGNIAADYAVTCACPSCVPAASSVTFHACGKLPNDNFQQGDPRWGSLSYDLACQVIGSTVEVRCDPMHSPQDTTPVTIKKEGCGLSSLATLNNIYHVILDTGIPTTDPEALNLFLSSPTIGGYKDTGVLRWNKIKNFSGNRITYIETDGGDIGDFNTQQSLLQTADNDLLAERPVIFHVKHRYLLPDGTSAISSHFVTAVGKCGAGYIISDPAGTRTLYDPNDPDFTFLGIRRFSP